MANLKKEHDNIVSLIPDPTPLGQFQSRFYGVSKSYAFLTGGVTLLNLEQPGIPISNLFPAYSGALQLELPGKTTINRGPGSVLQRDRVSPLYQNLVTQRPYGSNPYTREGSGFCQEFPEYALLGAEISHLRHVQGNIDYNNFSVNSGLKPTRFEEQWFDINGSAINWRQTFLSNGTTTQRYVIIEGVPSSSLTNAGARTILHDFFWIGIKSPPFSFPSGSHRVYSIFFGSGQSITGAQAQAIATGLVNAAGGKPAVNRPPQWSEATITLPDLKQDKRNNLPIALSSYVTDNERDPLTFSNPRRLPDGLSMDAKGKITGIPTLTAAKKRQPITFTVDVSDGKHPAVKGTFQVKVVNEPPRWSATTINLPDLKQGKTDNLPIDLAAYVTDSEGDSLIFKKPRGLPNGLSMDATNKITGTPNRVAAVQPQPITFTAEVSDGINPYVRGTFQVRVTNDPPQWSATTITLPDLKQGKTDNLPIELTDHITDPEGDTLTFRNTVGLPQGLSLNTRGKITGTPNRNAAKEPQPITFTTDVSDGINPPVKGTLQIKVTNEPPTWSATPVILPDLKQGETDNLPIQLRGYVTDPNSDALTFSNAVGLPDGLALYASGKIAGTPSLTAAKQTQPISFTVDVSDGVNSVVTGTLQVKIGNEPPTWLATPVILPDLKQGKTDNLPIDLTTYVTDPEGDSLSFSNAVGLPDGLSIDATGNITGTPTQTAAKQSQPISFSVDVSDGSNPAVTGTLQVKVTNAPPTWSATTMTLPDLKQGKTDNLPIDLTSFVTDPEGDSLTFSNGVGLPDGLSIDATGNITGTPTQTAAKQSQPISFTVDVSDGINAAVKGIFQVKVTNEPPKWSATTVSLPKLHALDNKNLPIDLTTYVTDPEGDSLSFSNAVGLPDGLSIDATGNITGPPTRKAAKPTQPVSFTVDVSDGINGAVTGTLEVTIESCPVDYAYNSATDHCYGLTSATNWTDAQAEAQVAGGDLVTINDQAEQDWLRTQFDSKIPGWPPGLWIGLNEPHTHGDTVPHPGPRAFSWVSGQSVSPTAFTGGRYPWGPSEPNNYGGNLEPCTIFTKNGWLDSPDISWFNTPGIVEIP
jgi:hypothetical protein